MPDFDDEGNAAEVYRRVRRSPSVRLATPDALRTRPPRRRRRSKSKKRPTEEDVKGDGEGVQEEPERSRRPKPLPVVHNVRPFSRSSGDWNQVFDSHEDAMRALSPAHTWSSMYITDHGTGRALGTGAEVSDETPLCTGDAELDELLRKLDQAATQPAMPPGAAVRRRAEYVAERAQATQNFRRRLGRRRADARGGVGRSSPRPNRHVHFRSGNLAAFDHSRLTGIHRQLLDEGAAMGTGRVYGGGGSMTAQDATAELLESASQRHKQQRGRSIVRAATETPPPSVPDGAEAETAAGASEAGMGSGDDAGQELPAGTRTNVYELSLRLQRLPGMPRLQTPSPSHHPASGGGGGSVGAAASFVASPIYGQRESPPPSPFGSRRSPSPDPRRLSPDVCRRQTAAGLRGIQSILGASPVRLPVGGVDRSRFTV
jgi:hypothetical protein|eukprot:COSAG01_NODE_6647_length_3564_cov_17.984132_4_plen_430_part_00